LFIRGIVKHWLCQMKKLKSITEMLKSFTTKYGYGFSRFSVSAFQRFSVFI